VLTVPNAISVGRLGCVPIFLWLLFKRHDRVGAAWLLAGLGVTDWVDGWIARRFDQVSELGKVLDPTADRVLLVVGIAAIMADGSAPMWVGEAVVARELLVAGTAVTLAALGADRIDVIWAGKAGTFAVMIAFPLFLIGHANISWRRQAMAAAWVWALPGLALAWYSVVRYVPLARNALASGRERSGQASSGPSGRAYRWRLGSAT